MELTIEKKAGRDFQLVQSPHQFQCCSSAAETITGRIFEGPWKLPFSISRKLRMQIGSLCQVRKKSGKIADVVLANNYSTLAGVNDSELACAWKLEIHAFAQWY